MSDFGGEVRIIPLNGRVLVKVKPKDKKFGCLYIPDNAKDVPIEGKVVAVSNGIYEYGTFRPHELHIGDHVIFRWKHGTDVILDDEEYRLLHETEIIAIVEGVNYD